ncbi:ABC1 kinase family protein [Desulfuromonas thiophila]|uniref:ABC1 kinase family protein n=1 Tax=Desulfuromonas thiophila TaxID=57664 RepID=UPI0024A86C40|nr:AarF/UbiB family protein [Desulfuromonas thiophila]
MGSAWLQLWRRGRLLAPLYRPRRLYLLLRVLVTLFLLLRRRSRWLGLTPLPPAALVAAIEQLGASFIKLAQVLATRADFFDEAYLAGLRQLQDRLPAMSAGDRDRCLALAFPAAWPFVDFDRQPLACASIGQVHRATLADGRLVAVKLRRFGIEQVVRADVRLLRLCQWLLQPLFSSDTRHSVEAVLSAFGRTIVEEVDMAQELAHLQQFRQLYGASGLRFPVPHPPLCSCHALVMDFEDGVRCDDSAALARLGVSFPAVMETLVRFYTEQMLVKGFFHADPHPGNLLVRPDGQLVLLDFGMVSRIPQETRKAMIYAVKAAYERDYALLVRATRRLGIITEAAAPEQLSLLAEDIFRIFSSEALSAASMQQLAFGVLDSLKGTPFKLPQEVVYVMRASSIIEGLGTRYIENFNGIKDVLPLLKANLGRALGEGEGLLDLLAIEAKQLPLTLVKTRQVIDSLEQGELVVHLAADDRRALLAGLARLLTRQSRWLALVLAAFYLRGWPQPWAAPLSLGCFSLALLLAWRGARD